MNANPDRLYELLPYIYRQRDVDQGSPLKALLRVISEQVNLVEADIDRLYANWFIETADDWVVPYLGDLIGYSPVHEAGEPSDVQSGQGQARNKILIPRREVANTVANRRRKGTLALLEQLAFDVANWPARAVESMTQLARTQPLYAQDHGIGRMAYVYDADLCDLSHTAFNTFSHSVDLRRPGSRRSPGAFYLGGVKLFVWRLQRFTLTCSPTAMLERKAPHRFTFTTLGHDAPLFTREEPETDPTSIAGELNLPIPITRRTLAGNLAAYYGEDKSFYLWKGLASGKRQAANSLPKLEAIPLSKIEVADLSGWHYRPRRGKVAVDPVLGRIAFAPSTPPKWGLWATWQYGFSAPMGGGEYHREIRGPVPTEVYQTGHEEKANRENEPAKALIFKVGASEELHTICDALDCWKKANPQAAIIEITDGRDYTEKLAISLETNQSLQLRAANGKRPVIRLLDWKTSGTDAFTVDAATGSAFTLDGLVLAGRPLHVDGPAAEVNLRHCTLVPGWEMEPDCQPCLPGEPSLELYGPIEHVHISKSILGSIQVYRDEVASDPLEITMEDSILDGMDEEGEAIGAPEWPAAHATLHVKRCTVFGQTHVHAIALASDSLFLGEVHVARRQVGCMRFCYVSPCSRTPRRYRCQPDLVIGDVNDLFEKAAEVARSDWINHFDGDQLALLALPQDEARAREICRVLPQFTATYYGSPAYAQLADSCAEEIKQGAGDASEMGVFHDLFQPQRVANLEARLQEYVPAGSEAGIFFVN